MTKRAVFIGRWTPFHNGHLKIMEEKIKQKVPLLILVRNTYYDVYPPELRKRMIEATMKKLKVDAKVEIIDDIESINYGRGVGYEVNEINVPDHIKSISATEIRNKIRNKDSSWKEFVPKGTDKILEDYLSGSGIVVWFTGVHKSGKSTIAKNVSNELEQMGIKTEYIDNKLLRSTISKDLGFSKKDRDTNIDRAKFIAKLLSRNGRIVLCSFITPYRAERKVIREEMEEHGSFVQVYVKSSLEVAKARDKEGLYERAEKGEIKDFTGISAPYEEPINSELVLDTEKEPLNKCVDKVIEHIKALM